MRSYVTQNTSCHGPSLAHVGKNPLYCGGSTHGSTHAVHNSTHQGQYSMGQYSMGQCTCAGSTGEQYQHVHVYQASAHGRRSSMQGWWAVKGTKGVAQQLRSHTRTETSNGIKRHQTANSSYRTGSAPTPLASLLLLCCPVPTHTTMCYDHQDPGYYNQIRSDHIRLLRYSTYQGTHTLCLHTFECTVYHATIHAIGWVLRPLSRGQPCVTHVVVKVLA